MDDAPLLVDRRPDRVVATLNRSDKRNAIDREMIDALHQLCAELEVQPPSCVRAEPRMRIAASTRWRSSASTTCRCR
jgi:hypothetical protein